MGILPEDNQLTENRSPWSIFILVFIAASALLLFPAIARCQSCVTNSQVTLTGNLRGANGIASSNYVMTMGPSQQGYIAGCGVNVPTTFACGTSTDGSVVGVPNPLTATINTTSGSGSLTAGVYYTVYEFYDAAGHVTLASPETRTTLSVTESLVVNPPSSGVPSTAVGMDVFIGTSSGAETLQGQTTGSAAFVQSTALSSGASPATTNTTLCKITANDAVWPVGTGYNVSLVDSNGNPVPGYPMQWQLLGPGSTYNLSNGLPYYHGVVLYPVPILAQPANHGQQSISGPLSLGGYNLTNVGKLGVGTATPGWGVDVEVTGIGGAINAEQGYLINGNAGAAGSCPISDGNYFDVVGVCDSGLNVLNFGAFCDSNGTTGNGHNDRAAIQALLNGLSPTLGAKILIPAGHICRIASTDTTINTDYLYAAVSNFEITGGGRLFFDPVLVSGHPTFGTAISGIYAAGLQIYSPGCTLSPVSNPEDITTGRAVTTLISNINLHDFSMSSVGSYNSLIWNNNGEPTTNIPLNNVGVAIWCANNVQVHHMNISNFYSDAIEPWGVVGLDVSNNQISQIGFNGVGAGWTSDETFSGNTMTGVGQGFETDALRSTYTGNVVSDFAMSGIEAVGGPTAGTNVSGAISGNTLTRDTTVAEGRYGISVACNGKTSTCVDNENVGPNTISGNFGASIYVQPGLAVSVHDNTVTSTAASGSPVGAIQAEEGSTWGTLNPITITNNTLNFTTTFYQSAIFATGLAAGGIQTIVKGNSITATSFTASPAWGIQIYSASGIACQKGNYSSAVFAPDSGCPSATYAGKATLSSGTVTVSTTGACTSASTCTYKLANCGLNGSTAIGVPSIGTVSVGTSFVINSLTATATVATGDASSVCWQIN
jgi:hypothetical protein